MLFTVKDPGSALTHFIGMIISVIAMPALLISASASETSTLISLAVFMITMICLYGASTAYHTFNLTKKNNLVLRKLDHAMIYVLIAGSYTPICISILPIKTGVILLTIIWLLAIAGTVFTMFFITCPKWLSSVLYISMGWACVIVLPQLLSILSFSHFFWLLAGGIMYTVGGIIYALKLDFINNRFPNFGSHEIFHIFVLIGSACHYIFMWLSA